MLTYCKIIYFSRAKYLCIGITVYRENFAPVLFSPFSPSDIHVKSPDLGGRLPLFDLISGLRSSPAREPPNPPTFFKSPAFLPLS